MKKKMKKNAATVSFSYLDVFLLLVTALILSFGIYLSTEQRRQEQTKPSFQVEALAEYEKAIAHAIPKEKEILFDGEGNSIGRVEGVQILDEGEATRVHLTLRLYLWDEDTKEITVETARSVCRAEVLSVTKMQEEEI